MDGKGKIVVTGDCCPGIGRVKQPAIRAEAFEIFGEFLTMIKNAELSITNLETPLIDQGTSIDKTGPALKSTPKTVEILKKAGFDLFTLSNNHIMDYGRDGLGLTLKVCNNAGINTVGAGLSPDEINKSYYSNVGGKRVAVINVAENEFGTLHQGGAGGHSLDPVANYNSILDAKKSSDRVLVVIHGGHEHVELPSPRMKKTYRFFVDAGADAVISHHTHCISGYEEYRGAPIFYGIGNFLFDNETGSKVTSWNKGIIVVLSVEDKGFSFDYHHFIQNGSAAGLKKPTIEEIKHQKLKIDLLNQMIADDQKLEEEFTKTCTQSRNRYSSYIEPHSSRILHYLQNRHWIPSFLSKQKKLLLLNLIRCESHRETLIQLLQNENSDTRAKR